jgi:hypothetical protein
VTTPTPAPAPTHVPAKPRRGPLSRLGLWLVITLWPAVAVFMLVAWLLWDRTDSRTAWSVAGGAALLFFALWAVFRARAKAAGRRVAVAFRGMLLALLVVAAVVGAVWLVFLR